MSTIPSLPPLLLQSLLSLLSFLLPSLLHFPALLLHGLHTYIHPDNLSPNDSLRAALRRPSDDPNSKPRRRPKPSDFDESTAQLFRLRLSDSHLPSRLHFPLLRLSFLLSSLALSNLSLLPFLSAASPSIPSIAAFLSFSHLLFSLLTLSLEKSASKSSERQLAALSGVLGFLLALPICFSLFPSLLDLDIGGGAASGTAAALSGILAYLLFSPSARWARSFWIGTDQLRWNLAVVSCGPLSRLLLYSSLLLTVSAPLTFIKPMAEVAGEINPRDRVWALAAAALSQLLVLRTNIQMYLNEAVLCWYQRLHSSRVPDLDYGRAKVFLHNHYLCLVVVQFFAPPVMVLVLLGVSQMRGNLFSGIFFSAGCLEDCSAVVKEVALFLGWWIVFVQAVLTMSSIALYRCGILFLS